MHEATLKRVRALFRLQADEGCRNPISLQAAGKSLKLTAVDWELEYQANDWFSFPLFLKWNEDGEREEKKKIIKWKSKIIVTW